MQENNNTPYVISDEQQSKAEKHTYKPQKGAPSGVKSIDKEKKAGASKPINGDAISDFIARIDKKLLLTILSVFINGILAGLAFSLGGVAYLSIDSRYLSSAVFTVGLFVVFTYGFGFYTSKIGYAFGQNLRQNLMLIPLWFGNLLGSVAMGLIFSLTRESIFNKLFERANEICGYKLADTTIGILILSLLCGVLMFIATDVFKNAKTGAQKYLVLFLASMTFVLCQFEHFALSAFYFTVANAFNLKAVWYIIVMTVGNSLGALIIPACHKGMTLLRGLAKKM